MIGLENNNSEVYDKKMSVCAVIGSPIKHSLSPQIHQQFAKQYGVQLIYKKILGTDKAFEAQVVDFFKGGGLGLNITTPFKSRAYELAVHRSENTKKSKVANTLWVNDKGEICSDSTDGAGLIYALKNHTVLKNQRVLMLGAGGAAQGVIESLLNESIVSLMVANRTYEKLIAIQATFPGIQIASFENLKNEFDIIINATTSSLNNTVPNIPAEIIKDTICLDMSYDLNRDTAFIDFCKKHGALKSIDGYEMLVGQAAKSFQIWHNEKVNVKACTLSNHY